MSRVGLNALDLLDKIVNTVQPFCEDRNMSSSHSSPWDGEKIPDSVQVSTLGILSGAEYRQILPPSSHAVIDAPFYRHQWNDSIISTQFAEHPSAHIGSKDAKPFVATHPSFLSLLGPSPTVECIAKRDWAFAHEAGVYVESTGKVWFTSNTFLSPQHDKDGLIGKRVKVSTLDLVTHEIEDVDLEGVVNTGNGGCPFGSWVLLCEQGEGPASPSRFVAINPEDPKDNHVVLNNYHGRPFNSLNDAVLLPPPAHFQPGATSMAAAQPGWPGPGWTLWFTDPTYAHEQGFRGAPQLPSQVYVFNPQNGDVRVVADGIGHPNGICFSPDGATCYVTDTDLIKGTGEQDPHRVSTMWAAGRERGCQANAHRYAYDVVWHEEADITIAGPSLRNKRVFAFGDTGVPDGSKHSQPSGGAWR